MSSPKNPTNIVIVEGARTPIGSFLGGLSKISATDLGAFAAKGAIARAAISAEQIDQVVVGNVIQSSKDAAYIARHVGLKAGVPEAAPALTVNRACGSGLDAIACGARLLRSDEARFVLAGGAENMSMTPYAMRGVRTGWRMVKSQVDDMLFSALHDPMAGCSIGETVEHLAETRGVTREAADAFAALGQARAKSAMERGVYAEEIVEVVTKSRRKERRVSVDESPRPETTEEVLATLPGLYGGVITAGNSTGLNDAAAMVILCREEDAPSAPLGRVVSFAASGVAPIEMGIGPVTASRLALSRAGLTLDEMDLIEINDSFAVQYLAVEAELGLDREKVNVNGGAIALGHPMGATGTRLVLSALYELRRRGGGRALCTVCVGGGQGVAMIVER